ncbi:MAG: cysteine ABC transporter permease [Rhodobacteraceae bacterium]|nr:cysteine ABC transporter permease [Paracoccaceae bacterium]
MARSKTSPDARLLAPVQGLLRRAAAVSVLGGLLWPVQAAAIATAISGWVDGAALDRSLWAAGVFLVAALLRAGLDHVAGGWLFTAADTVIADQRRKIVERALLAPGPESSAETAALAVQKLPMLQPWITRYNVAMARVMVLPLVLIVLSGVFSWVTALILLVATPLIPVFMALVGMAAEDASRKQLDEIGTINGMLMERVSAMLDIRLLGAADRAMTDFADRADALRVRTMAVLRVAFLSSTVLELFAAIGVDMVAVYVGFSLLGVLRFGTWGSPLTLWQGLFLLLLAPDVFQPLRDLAAAWHDRASGRAVATELADADAAPRVALIGQGAPATPLPGPLSVRLDGAVAALPGRTLPLPDLTLAQGEAVALTGPSGAGKTTLLSVLAGLTPLAEGRLQVCGQPLAPDTADAWRARLAVLPQRVHFADEPLSAFLDPFATGADPWPALATARARRIVDRLPDGLATRLGETGGGVSGGEARRLMIARAILMGRDLLLADEPTADLDPETADLITQALLAMTAQGVTLLVATHDPGLAAALDRRVEIGS